MTYNHNHVTHTQYKSCLIDTYFKLIHDFHLPQWLMHWLSSYKDQAVSLPNIHDWSKHDQAPHCSWQWPTCGDHLYLLCMFQPPCLLHLSSWVPCTHALYTHIDIVFKVSVATLLQGTIIIQLSRHPSKQSTLRLWNEQHTYSMLLVFGMLTGMAARLNDNSV